MWHCSDGFLTAGFVVAAIYDRRPSFLRFRICDLELPPLPPDPKLHSSLRLRLLVQLLNPEAGFTGEIRHRHPPLNLSAPAPQAITGG